MPSYPPSVNSVNSADSDGESGLTATATVKHDPQFYFDPLFVRVRNTLFQVPRIAFEGRAGSPFAEAATSVRLDRDGVDRCDELEIGQPHVGEYHGNDYYHPAQSYGEGRSAENPVVLHVALQDFRNLLHVMYAKGSIIPGHTRTITPEQWMSALRLSTMWNFEDIRQDAITALEGSPILAHPMDLIITARQSRVRKWLVSGYQQLVLGNIEDLQPHRCGDALGWGTLSRLLYLRHQHDVAEARAQPPRGEALIVYLSTDPDTRLKLDCGRCGMLHSVYDSAACFAPVAGPPVARMEGVVDPVMRRLRDAIEVMLAGELRGMD